MRSEGRNGEANEFTSIAVKANRFANRAAKASANRARPGAFRAKAREVLAAAALAMLVTTVAIVLPASVETLCGTLTPEVAERIASLYENSVPS